jgi:hypothetical protein
MARHLAMPRKGRARDTRKLAGVKAVSALGSSASSSFMPARAAARDKPISWTSPTGSSAPCRPSKRAQRRSWTAVSALTLSFPAHKGPWGRVRGRAIFPVPSRRGSTSAPPNARGLPIAAPMGGYAFTWGPKVASMRSAWISRTKLPSGAWPRNSARFGALAARRRSPISSGSPTPPIVAPAPGRRDNEHPSCIEHRSTNLRATIYDRSKSEELVARGSVR